MRFESITLIAIKARNEKMILLNLHGNLLFQQNKWLNKLENVMATNILSNTKGTMNFHLKSDLQINLISILYNHVLLAPATFVSYRRIFCKSYEIFSPRFQNMDKF